MSDEFRFGKLGLGSRLALAAGLFASGIALQLAAPRAAILGIAIVVAGWFPLMLRVATNKPEDQGLEEWRPVSMAEFDRLDDGIKKSKTIKRKTGNLKTGVLIGLASPFILFVLVAFAAMGRRDVIFVFGNTIALLVPALFFGRVRAFVPQDIAFKMPSFRSFLTVAPPAEVVVVPYIRFDKDKAGLDVPEDLRLMLELKRKPADLVGIQVQASVNKGPNGPVPYLYAVVLTKGASGPAYSAARGFKRKGFEVEPGSDGDYGTVVIRQETESGGYHTTPDDCRELMESCKACLSIISRASRP